MVQLDNGSWLGLDAVTDIEPLGRAWLGTVAQPTSLIEIELDCIGIDWHVTPYPTPPYLPYHAIVASGVGTDGVRYYITAYDAPARPVGLGDYAGVGTMASTAACGGSPLRASRIRSGEITVFP